jgi:membrane protein
MADDVSKAPNPLVVRAQNLIAAIQRWKPVRVFMHYGARRGALLSAGLSYQAIFAVFAAVWVGFSVAGLVLRGSPALQNALFDVIGNSVPGLIDRGAGGAIDPDALLSAGVLGWVGAISLVGTLLTAVGWLGSARDAVRDIAQLAAPPTNFLLLKAKDLGLALVFGAALLLSAGLSVASTAAVEGVVGGLGGDPGSTASLVAVRLAGLLLMFALDAGVLAGLYRVLAGVAIPPGPLWQGALLGAAALGVLKVLGSALLGGASSNPLLASFAVIIGLLLWFNLVCQVILIAASWVVVSATDAGVPLDPIGERDRREREARLRLEIEEQVRAEFEAQLPRAVRWLARRRRQLAERSEP